MFLVRIIGSKYPKRIGNLYNGGVSNDSPYYITTSKDKNQIKVKFTPVYRLNRFIHIIGKTNEEIGEILQITMEEAIKMVADGTDTVITANLKKIPKSKAVKIGIYYYELNKDVAINPDTGEYVLLNREFVKCEITGNIIPLIGASFQLIDSNKDNLILGVIDASLNNSDEAFPLAVTMPIKNSDTLNNLKEVFKAKDLDFQKNPILDSNLIVNFNNIFNKENKQSKIYASLNRSKFDELPFKVKNVFSKEVLTKLKAVEALSHGVFVTDPKVLKDLNIPEYRKFNNKKSNKDLENKADKITFGTDSDSYLLTNSMQYTFGVEFETASGIVPAYASKGLNVECMRDGSIPSGEYVTGVLKGDAGIIQINSILHELSRRCTLNPSCGLHVHIGSADFTKKFTIAAYCLGQMLYNSLTTVVSPSRSFNRYCNQMPNFKPELYKLAKGNSLDDKEIIHNLYMVIYNWLCDGENMSPSPANDDYPKAQSHKMGRGYNRAPRYTWLNLIPSNFHRVDRNNSTNAQVVGKSLANTIEFRLHHGSLDFIDIYYWIILCMLFTNYCENNANQIIQAYITGEDITLDMLVNSLNNESLKDKLKTHLKDKNKDYCNKSEKEFLKVKEQNLQLYLKVV